MNKINYQKQLDKVIENLGETKPTLLLPAAVLHAAAMSWNISPNILISPLTTTIQISTPKKSMKKESTNNSVWSVK